MFERGKKYKRDGHGLHLIIVCDEAGIYDAYNLLMDRLSGSGNAFLSLIYTVSDKNPHPIFEKELSILEKRFSADLIVHILRVDTTIYCSKQEIMEATINSNTVPVMKFIVFGSAEFVKYVTGILRFLDVEAFMINLKII